MRDTYPSKPIRLIVPWPAGGGVDTSARIISQPLVGAPRASRSWSTTEPGAAGNIGTALAAKEKPDGYTLLMGSLSPNAVNPHLYTSLGFDPIKDFAPDRAGVHGAELPGGARQLAGQHGQELIAHAKANPGKLNMGSGGVGSSQHLFGVMFTNATKIDIVHVAYKGTSPAETALIAGQVDFMLDPPTCLPFVEAGKLKALAVASPVKQPGPAECSRPWTSLASPACTPRRSTA